MGCSLEARTTPAGRGRMGTTMLDYLTVESDRGERRMGDRVVQSITSTTRPGRARHARSPLHFSTLPLFNAVYLTRDDDRFEARVTGLDDDRLPAVDREVTIAVAHSTINYKDGLAITDRGPVVRRWADGRGRRRRRPGRGQRPSGLRRRRRRHPQRLRGRRDALGLPRGTRAAVRRLAGALPASLSTADAMAIGTAGYTAMLSVMALEDAGLRPDHGDVLVTGASGGVGSIAIALLSSRGFRVVASTGRLDEASWLARLGAAEVVDRATLAAAESRCRRNAGRPPSTRSARIRWPTSARRCATAAWLRRAGLRRGWTSRHRSRRSSCAASNCSASTA